MLMAANMEPWRQGEKITPVSSEFLNLEELLLAALKTDPPHISFFVD